MKKFRPFQTVKNAHKRLLYVLAVLMLTFASLVGYVPGSNMAHAAIGSVTEYPLPVSGSGFENMTLGPDGNIWYTANGPTINKRVGKLTPAGVFTEYPNPVSGGKYLRGITAGPDGDIWYSEQVNTNTGENRIVNISSTGTVLGSYTLPGSNGIPMSMISGPDGAVWFNRDGTNKIGRITTAGVITEYSVSGYHVNGITVGSDGNIWYTSGRTGSLSGNGIGKLTIATGTSTYYPLSTYSAYPVGITAGPDGNLWFAEEAASKVGKITTSGIITEYTTLRGSQGITVGSDGALWFTQYEKIGRITTLGNITYYDVPGVAGGIETIVAGSDGAVWFNYYGAKILRMATELSSQTISFTSTEPTNAVIDGPSYAPTASATSGLAVSITVDPSSSSVCSIDGSGKVSFQGAGTCTLNANQGGDADYNPAPQVQQSFTVAPVDADTSVIVDCPATALVGTTVECTITIENNGPAAAENLSLTALFSDSFTGESLSGGGTLSGQTITWSTASLAPGTPVTLTFDATASLASKASFSASVLQTNPDLDISNNIDDAKIVIS